jgi:peptidoglycan-N-acetylglucosamine deacetylase
MSRLVDSARWHLDPERLRHRLGGVRGTLPGGRGVCLSFDDGPDGDATPAILDELAAHDARATFFCVGRRAVERPDLVRRILADGHTIGSHSDEHRHPSELGVRSLRRSFDRGRHQLEDVVGRPVTLFRPPTGLVTWTSAVVARQLGLRTWLWSVDPEDWRGGTRPEQVVDAASRARGGDIVLLHDAAELPESPAAHDRSATVKAVAAVVIALRAAGHDIVPIPEESNPG